MSVRSAKLASLGLAACLWIVATGPATAHEDAVLEADRSAAAAGNTLALDGREFTAGAEYQLRLVGTLDEYDITKVQADSTGRFRVDVTVPSAARPGRYRLVAVAGDGDEVAGADLRVTDRAAASSPPDTAADGSASSHRPRIEEMNLPRERSGLDWSLILVLIGGAGGLGAIVLRGAEGDSVKEG